MSSAIRVVLNSRVLVVDGAMGTMLQGFDTTLEDFDGFEGCNEILNVTRPDIVESIHRAYLEAGADCIETNTFGANHAALGEYEITDRIGELAAAGTRIARRVADEYSTPERPRFVLGSVGPGTKLPSLGHIDFDTLVEGYERQVQAMIDEGVDAIQIETCQDLLQAKAGIIATKRRRAAAGIDLPIFCLVTVETTGTMLLGTETLAALRTLEPLGIDVIGLNCATGPAEMSEHLRALARAAHVGIMAMPNAGLPELTADGPHYPLTPQALADAADDFCSNYGLSLVGGCCGTTPDHIALLASRVAGREVPAREVPAVNAVASLYHDVDLKQETSYLTIGERTNANGSKAFREAMLESRFDDCLDIAKAQSRSGAHVLDLCVDYVGRDGRLDMAELTSRFATSVTQPIVIDSTEPPVIEVALKHLPGRSIINSVNFEDGDGPESRFQRIMPLVAEHGAGVIALTIDEEGQARTTEWKLRVANRLIDSLVGEWGMDEGDILVDCLTFPIGTGQDETRRDGLSTIEAIRELKREHPRVGTTLGVSNISFGLNPAARVVLNSVFLDECVKAGLNSAIVAKIMPVDRIDAEQYDVALDLIYDRRRDDYDPLARFLELFENVDAASLREQREAELASMSVAERLARRIIDGNSKDLERDLDEALESTPPLDIINDHLLEGMKVVGELFGSGQMQLPFVLQSAETMKKAVAYLEGFMDDSQQGAGKGTLILATVKGDVHDIGKNLVDIIVSNNGYTVVNLGIKQSLSTILDAAEEHDADVIGMSGLLVKSTVVMKDNLLELNERGAAGRFPVLLGGAALTRAYVDDDLAKIYDGTVRYAKDAFEGLDLMKTFMAIKNGDPDAKLPPRRPRRVKPKTATEPKVVSTERSEHVRRGIDVPTPPFWGSKVAKGIGLSDITRWLDEKALFMGRWGLRPGKGGADYDSLVATDGRPRLRALLDEITADGLGEFAAVYGYFPCYSEGNTLHVCDPEDVTNVVTSYEFPRQSANRRLCLADFFRDADEVEENGPDVVALQLVTMGQAISRHTAELFEANEYRHYVELHGLSVQLTEALAELWHQRIRAELGFAREDGEVAEQIAKQDYRGSRFSFGYPACPDLEMRGPLCEMLGAERIGVTLSPEFQLDPEQSTDALVVCHPQAKYFSAR